MDNSYSLSDIAVATGNDGWGGGMGGGWFAWILLFALFGGNGFGFNNRGNAVTEADLCNANSFSELKNSVGRLNDNQAAIARQTDNAICQLGYQALQNTNTLSSQMASCCCDLKTAIHAEGEATRNMIQQNKIETLQQQVNALHLSQALCGIPRTSPYGYGIYAYPACSGVNACGNCAY